MKLITFNIEGLRHLDLAHAFIAKEKPDILCLQETPESFLPILHNLGYQTTFGYRCTKMQENQTFNDGVVLASLTPHSAEIYNYHHLHKAPDDTYDPKNDKRRNNHSVLINGQIETKEGHVNVITTQFTWAKDGSVASQSQKEDLSKILEYTTPLEPHLLCGDFNIPRHHNELYEDLIALYQDNIPDHYHSSLDKEYHRKGNDPALAHLFTDYMVDYIFSQPPYEVTNVRLEFGLSDHAAVIGEITKRDVAR